MHLTQEVTRITGAQGRLDNRRSRFDRRPSPHPLSPPSWGRCPLYTGCPPCPPSICPLSQGPFLLSCLTPDPGSLGQGLGRGRKWPGPARNAEPLCPARHLPCGTGWSAGPGLKEHGSGAAVLPLTGIVMRGKCKSTKHRCHLGFCMRSLHMSILEVSTPEGWLEPLPGS